MPCIGGRVSHTGAGNASALDAAAARIAQCRAEITAALQLGRCCAKSPQSFHSKCRQMRQVPSASTYRTVRYVLNVACCVACFRLLHLASCVLHAKWCVLHAAWVMLRAACMLRIHYKLHAIRMVCLLASVGVGSLASNANRRATDLSTARLKLLNCNWE